MIDPKYLRARAAHLIALSHTIPDAPSRAALIEVADNLVRWADELEGIDPPKSNGA